MPILVGATLYNVICPDIYWELSVNITTIPAEQSGGFIFVPGTWPSTGVFAGTQPVNEPGLTLSGAHFRTFADDYYNRIHVTPGALDVGNLLGNQVRSIEVWNAWLDQSKLLSSIDATGADGITLTGPRNPPTTFMPLESLIYTLTVLLSGPPVIDASFVFNFPLEHPSLTTIGKRVVVFFPRPKHPVLETLEWLTDIIEAYDGGEQRIRLRNAPRQGFEMEVLVAGANEQARLESIIFGWQNRMYGLPCWHEQRRLGQSVPAGSGAVSFDTSSADYRPGGMAIILEAYDKLEVLEVLSVQSDSITLKRVTALAFAPGALIMPMRLARLDAKIGREDELVAGARYRCSFTVTDNADLSGSASTVQYKGADVLDKSYLTPDNTVKREIVRPMEVIDYGTGIVTVDARSDYPVMSTEQLWCRDDRAACWAFRQWLHRRAGRLNPIWIPSWRHDFELAATVGASDTSVRVKDTLYRLYVAQKPTRKDIAFVLKDGTLICREITGSDAGLPGEEILSISSGPGVQIDSTNLWKISFLTLHRFSSDRIEISWHMAGKCEVRASMAGVAQ